MKVCSAHGIHDFVICSGGFKKPGRDLPMSSSVMLEHEKKNWFDMLQTAMKADGEEFDKRICTLDEPGLRKMFEVGYGMEKGQHFTAWGERWVYFPLCYDGLEWVGHAPRNPCDIAMAHQGR